MATVTDAPANLQNVAVGPILAFGIDPTNPLKCNALVVDPTGTAQVQGVAGGTALRSTSAGLTNAAVAAAAVAAAIVVRAGRVASILVTSLGTVQMTVTDGAAGTVIAIIPSGAAIGTEIKVDRLFATSLYVNSLAGSPALTVSYD